MRPRWVTRTDSAVVSSGNVALFIQIKRGVCVGGGGGEELYCFVDEQLCLVTCLKPRIGSPRKHDRDNTHIATMATRTKMSKKR